MNGLKTYSAYLAFCGLCFSSSALNANPEGGTVVNGSATFDQQGSTLTVTNTPGTIINWQDFSIQAEETTRFVQQSADSAVLNRVVGQDPSQILGKLQSNGRVFIINPNGIVFGADSVIDVSGLAASTLNLSNEDFLSQNLNFTGDGTNENINNQGSITTSEGGFVYLIASNVENHGVITSPKGEVILAAGHSVQLVSSDDPDIRVTLTAPEGEALNVGEIITRGGKTSIYAGIINQQGKISADSAVVGENGKIFFKARQRTTLTSTSVTTANGNAGGNVIIKTTQGLTEVSGVVTATGDSEQGGEILILGEHVGILDEANIDVSGQTGGGTILIGGDNKGSNPDIQNSKATYVGVNTIMHADAVEEGNGGKVIVWSDYATRAYGTITARGGSISGNGGFVETSGGYLDVAGLNLDITATNGSGGTWLLDPYDITITGTTTLNNSGIPNFTATAAGSNIFNGDINAQLDAGTAVIVDTTGGGAESGNITVSAAISKAAGPATTLTLKAHNNIVTDASIGSTNGALNITLTADQDSNGVGSVTLNNTLTSLDGNINISSAGDITLNSGTTTINSGAASTTLTVTTNGLISGDPAGAPTDIIANSLNLNSVNGIHANGGSAQFTIKSNSTTFTNSGNGLVRIHNSFAGTSSISGSSNSGDIIIQNTDSANALIVGNITASNGLISLNSDVIDITGNVNAGTNTVYLKNFVNNTIVSIEGSALFDISSAELANITAGNIQIGKDTFGNVAGAASIGSSAVAAMGGKNVWVTAQNGITVGAFGITNTGGQLYLDNITTGDIGTGGNITSGSAQFRSIGIINIGGGGITTTTGDINLFASDVNIFGAVNAGANKVLLAPYLTNTAISIGGSQTFNITSADLNNISAGSINIGENLASAVYASTVDIASATAVNIGAQTLRVYGANDITFGANNYTATGDNTFQSVTGNITTGAGLVSSDILVLEGAGLMSVGTGGITTTNYTGLSGGNVYISGTVTTPILYLTAFTPGSVISVGGGQTFNIAQADIDFINATSTEIGNNPYVTNTSSIEMATSAPIDFGSRNVIFKSDNGMTFGANAFKATGGNLTFNSANAGFDITTGAGNIAANTVTMNSGRNIIINAGGINALSTISINAATTIAQNGNLTSTGGSISLAATSQDATMAAGTVTTSGNGNVNYTAGGNITVAMLDAGTGNTTLNAASAITDVNGIGVNNINANNLTVSSGGNTSLDYQITGALNSTGVVGTADLRVFPAGSGTTTTTTSSTNEPLTTTIATIANTTNTLSTGTTSTSTTTTLSEPTATDTSTDTTTSDTTTESSSTTTDGTTSETTASNSEEEPNKESESTTTTSDKKQTQSLAKKLPICK